MSICKEKEISVDSIMSILLKDGVVIITGLHGSELASKDLNGKSDPFCRVGYVLEDSSQIFLEKNQQRFTKDTACEPGRVFHTTDVTKASLSFRYLNRIERKFPPLGMVMRVEV
jgi:hypothetical protein